MNKFLIAFLGLAVSGCISLPVLRHAQPDLPSSWPTATAPSERVPGLVRWWTLYDDPVLTAGWMRELRDSGRFEVDDTTRDELQAELTGAWVDNDTCLATIGEVYREHGYLLDPHTAVAWKVAAELGGEGAPVLIASTAHWSKFAADVVRGLRGVPAGAPIPGEADDLALLDRVVELAPGASIPPQLTAVRSRPRRFDARVAGGREAVEASLRGWLAEA